MKVRIHQNIVSVHGTYHPGQVVDLPDKVAEVWLKKGELISQVIANPKPAKIPKGMYWCGKCQSLHRLVSPKGVKHLKHRIE